MKPATDHYSMSKFPLLNFTFEDIKVDFEKYSGGIVFFLALTCSIWISEKRTQTRGQVPIQEYLGVLNLLDSLDLYHLSPWILNPKNRGGWFR